VRPGDGTHGGIGVASRQEEVVYFPVAGIELAPWIPPAVAFAISAITSLGGVSGAFLLLPFQVSVLGFHGPAVSATNHLFNVVATPAGVWRYARDGRVVWPIALAIIAGALPGVGLGAILRVEFLQEPQRFKTFVGLVLLYVGARLLWEAVSAWRRPRGGGSALPQPRRWQVDVTEANTARIVYMFGGRRFEINVAGLCALSLAVGVIGGIYGIGGGALVAPLLVSLFRLPVYTVAGAALLATFTTSAAAVISYLALAQAYPAVAVLPDWRFGLLFGAGGLAGMYLGAALQKFVPATAIKLVLAVCVLTPAVGYFVEALGRL
jgi:uncharacterized membrane protein YfcA